MKPMEFAVSPEQPTKKTAAIRENSEQVAQKNGTRRFAQIPISIRFHRPAQTTYSE